jgi:hypothetical protein
MLQAAACTATKYCPQIKVGNTAPDAVYSRTRAAAHALLYAEQVPLQTTVTT